MEEDSPEDRLCTN